MHKLLHGAKGNVANILRAFHILQILIYILTFSVNLHQINDGRIKQKDLYHRNFFYTMLYSDPHFVLQGDLTRWLPTTNILIIIGRIYCHQCKCNYLKNQKDFLNFYGIFGMYIKFWKFWKKSEPHSSSISEVIDSEKTCLLKCIKGLVSGNPLALNVLKMMIPARWILMILIKSRENVC